MSDPITMQAILWHGWDPEPSVLAGTAALAGLYWVYVRPRQPRHLLAWMGGLALLLLALISPLDPLSDDYLFSAHMLQHLILLEAVCPLLIWGIPGAFLQRALTPRLRTIEQALTQPVFAWTLATLSLLVWHLPGPYNAALANENIHIVMHLNFLVAWTIFWWPLLAPPPARRYSAGVGFVYLLLAGVVSNGLGIAYFFLPVGLYPLYLHQGPQADPRGWLAALHGAGMYPLADQRLGGLIMWVPGTLIFLIGCFKLIHRWMQPSNPMLETEMAP